MQSNLQVREVHRSWGSPPIAQSEVLVVWKLSIDRIHPRTMYPTPESYQAAFVAVEGDLTAWVTSSQGAGGPVAGAEVALYFSKGYNSVSGRMGVWSAACCCLCMQTDFVSCCHCPAFPKKPPVSNRLQPNDANQPTPRATPSPAPAARRPRTAPAPSTGRPSSRRAAMTTRRTRRLTSRRRGRGPCWCRRRVGRRGQCPSIRPPTSSVHLYVLSGHLRRAA
jgi:hypothetical protein